MVAILSSCQTSANNPSITQEENIQKTTIEVLYIDKRGRQLHAVYDNLHDTVTLEWAGQTQTLPRVISASGAKFSNGVSTFWNKGATALYIEEDTILFQGAEKLQIQQ